MTTSDGRPRPVPGSMFLTLFIATAATAWSALTVPPAPAPPWTAADSTYRWRFPRDHWSHPGYKTEWWYLTGHLTVAGDTAPRFGYQVTFFRVGLVPERPPVTSPWSARDLIMGHVALSDLATGRHQFSELLYRAVPLLGGFGAFPDSVLAWSRGPAGTDAEWRLLWNGQAFDIEVADRAAGLTLQLETRPAKPLVFQGPNGFSRKGTGPTAASLYYSFTRLTTTGRLTLGADTLEVTGQSWMDKEFGSNQLDGDQTGWDWFSLQLDDGREVMLYHLRGASNTARGTIISPEGTATYLDGGDWTLQPTAWWSSPATGARYPARWRLTLPGAGLDLDIRPFLASQENVSRLVPDLAYWEGAVAVRDAAGRALGRGYVELTGYAPEARLPL